jgi:hypothetical protein
MKRNIFYGFLLFVISVCAAGAAELSCGAGYVLTELSDTIDKIPVAECQKLWCVDLENGKNMGNGARATVGYVMTMDTVTLCDNEKNCVECWGDRTWCAGEAPGYWNPKYGAYTRNGDDNATYESYQKGSCFAWRLEKPQCADGLTAILQDNQWICATVDETTGVSRESAVRRTGAMRHVKM